MGEKDTSKLKNDSSSATIKAGVLLLLVVQNTSLVLLMRWTRTRDTEANTGQYVASSVVVMQEVLKLSVCLCVIAWQGGGVGALARTLNTKVFGDWRNTVRLAVPAALYTIQSNVLWLAIQNLSAPVYMVSGQLKVLATAALSVLMLGKSLTRMQYVALGLLQIGVILVQLAEHRPDADSGLDGDPTELANENEEEAAVGAAEGAQNAVLGVACVAFACLSSAFAGVYFEKLLKERAASMWVRNVQLGLFALPFSYVAMLTKDGEQVRANGGMLQGYDTFVWLVVVDTALGGLTVAAVMKYADNIVKGFATSASIVLGAVISMLVFDFEASTTFVMGSALVIASIFFYTK